MYSAWLAHWPKTPTAMDTHGTRESDSNVDRGSGSQPSALMSCELTVAAASQDQCAWMYGSFREKIASVCETVIGVRSRFSVCCRFRSFRSHFLSFWLSASCFVPNHTSCKMFHIRGTPHYLIILPSTADLFPPFLSLPDHFAPRVRVLALCVAFCAVIICASNVWRAYVFVFIIKRYMWVGERLDEMA